MDVTWHGHYILATFEAGNLLQHPTVGFDALPLGDLRDPSICLEHGEHPGQVIRAGRGSHLVGEATFELGALVVDERISDRARRSRSGLWSTKNRVNPDAAVRLRRHGGSVRILLNVVWLVFGGFAMVLGYLLAGVVACILIVTIPFGIAAFRIASFAAWPFGRTIVDTPTAGVGSAIGNVIWFLFAGLWIAIGHLTLGAALCLTIIGIPLGLAHFKLIPVSIMLLGKQIVPA